MGISDTLFKGNRKYATGAVLGGAGLAVTNRLLQKAAPKKNYEVELEIEAPWLKDIATKLTENVQQKGLALRDSAANSLEKTLGNVDWGTVLASNMASSYRKRLNRLAEFASYPYRQGYQVSAINPGGITERRAAVLEDFEDEIEPRKRIADPRTRTLAKRKSVGRDEAFLKDQMVVGKSQMDDKTFTTVKSKDKAFDAAQASLAKTDRETRRQINRLDRYRRSLQGQDKLKEWERGMVPTREEAKELEKILGSDKKQESIDRLRTSYTDIRELRNQATPSNTYVVPGLKEASKQRRKQDIKGLAGYDPKAVPKQRVPMSALLGKVGGEEAFLTYNRLPAYAPDKVSGWNSKNAPLRVQYTPTLPTGATAQDRAIAALNRARPSSAQQAPKAAQTANNVEKTKKTVEQAAETVKETVAKAPKAQQVATAANTASSVASSVPEYRTVARTVWDASSDRGARRALGLAAVGSSAVLGGLALGSVANRFKEQIKANRLDKELDKELEQRRQQALQSPRKR